MIYKVLFVILQPTLKCRLS